MNCRGMALILGLLLLAALSSLALASMNDMVMQRRMTANSSHQAQALTSADRAAAAARAWLDSRADIEREAGCSADCLLPPAIHGPGELPQHPEFESLAWWQAQAVRAGTHPETSESLGPALDYPEASWWIMEELRYLPLPDTARAPAAAGVGYYRIYARGTGPSPGSAAVTESIVARPWEGEFEPLEYPRGASEGSFCRQFEPTVPCGMQAWRLRR